VDPQIGAQRAPPMALNRDHYDVCVIGGGPVGSTTAIAFARRGARVLVLEADPRAARRFAGEWIHPAGVAVLDALRAGRLESATPCVGYGFVIFPGDGSAPIELPYPEGIALSAPHESIVSGLREAALGVTGVELISQAQVIAVEGHKVTAVKRPGGERIEVSAERVVGADGRSSMVRRQLGFEENSTALSYMASVDLCDLALPFEGFGHVVLGGPGPVLIYRVSDSLVRGCFDVPVQYGPSSRSAAFLWEAYRRVLPERMLRPFQRGIEGPNLRWAATRFRPRSHFGRGPVALVGDAVGHMHPMTALGLSMGFLDAASLAKSQNLVEYARERRGYIPELLSNALYHCFRRDDASAKSMREATFRALRSSAAKRRQTMQILSAQDQRTRSFGSICLSVAAGAIGSRVTQATREGGFLSVPGALAAFGEWVQWPAAALVPPALRNTYRDRSTATHPIPFLRSWVPVAPEATTLGALGRTPELGGRRGAPRTDTRSSSAPKPPRVGQAVTKVTELLIADLEALASEIEATPDEILAVRGLRMMRAVVATHMRSGVAARMTIGRRWLARNGMPRLLEAAETRGTFTTVDLAGLLVILLGSAGSGDTEIVDLEDGIDLLLRLQTEGGSFATRASGFTAGEEGDVQSTALSCQALVGVRRLMGVRNLATLDKDRLDKGIARAAHWLVENVPPLLPTDARDDGKGLARVVSVLEALSTMVTSQDGSVASVAAWMSRASSTLALGLGAGDFARPRASSEAAELIGTALALRGVLLSLASGVGDDEERSAASGATRQLTEKVLDTSSAISAPSSGGLARWEICSEILSTLALCETTVKKAGDIPKRTSGDAPHKPDPTEAEWIYCRERLGEVSRSFSQPIALLPHHLEVAVTLAYLLCRVADSIEDHVAVPHAARAPLMARFIDVLNGREEPGDFASAFLDAIGKGRVGADPELILTANLAVVMRVLGRQADATRATLVRWIAEMARGMSLYTFRSPGEDGIVALSTVADLERYCYFVAGTVGHLLTDLFVEELGAEATPELALTLRLHAEHFGMGLQLVNILKDLTDDQARRWSYIPRTLVAARSLGIADLGDPARRASAHAAVAPLFDIAKASLDDGMKYALAIPARHAGIRRFCLLPLWMAARTLVLAKGSDAMFTPGDPVKIPRDEVASLSTACVTHSSDDDFLRKRYASLWSDGPDSEERRSAG
jgi:2-polyprenyl-6-methoxyphenol hydroxylase-like FAD-dependent oxidoreductase/phytoene/squalene synthetase